MLNEFVIWGKAPDTTIEQLLVVKINKKRITDKSLAEKCKRHLESINCKDVRIQEIVLSRKIDILNSFLDCINKTAL